MTTPVSKTFTNAQRLELRSYVELAGEPIANFWPMRTFIHHNPLHGLETMPFDEAVRRGMELFGARGYLSNEAFRRYVVQGRITTDDVRAAVQPLARGESVALAGRTLSHQDLLTAVMIHRILDEPTGSTFEAARPDPDRLSALTAWLDPIMDTQPSTADHAESHVPDDEPPSAHETLAAWCDRTFGSRLVETMNREMVKWCSAFLDEGEAGWAMPTREQTFYRAWKSLARFDATLRLIGIRDAARKIDALPDRPEDAVLEHLQQLGIAQDDWEAYLSRHLSALPGWTGFIKWRAHQSDSPWQREFPIDLVKYVAVRLFYERELVELVCRTEAGIAGQREAIARYRADHPYGYWLRRRWKAGALSVEEAGGVARLAASDPHQASPQWETEGRRLYEHSTAAQNRRRLQRSAQRLLLVATACGADPTAVETTAPADVRKLLAWLEDFPPARHGAPWLEALESAYRRRLLGELAAAAASLDEPPTTAPTAASRPLAQMVFCIDVRSEVFRRHLEERGGYETLGLAGFFGVPLNYQAFNAQHLVIQCPVLLKPKNHVRELPRSYHGILAERHKTAAQIAEAARTLLHDLKENVVTPYVMVEAIGWFFSLPFFGKTLAPRWYHGIDRRLREWFAPKMATTLTVDKLSRNEAEEMVAAEQRGEIRGVLREQFALSGSALSPTTLESIRQQAITPVDAAGSDAIAGLPLSPGEKSALYRTLRDAHRISPRGTSERLDRITQTGFSVAEQTYFVEAALRLMGLTSNFSRLVVFCAHRSRSLNNPYESALDCGACGGNQGLPNARVIADMANHAVVRTQLAARGISIPSDTHFLAAQHDTTTDRVEIADLEDVPPTHRKDLQRLLADLDDAGTQAALERNRALGHRLEASEKRRARFLSERRSEDWSEVRPEWGLSKNSAMIIGRRAWTQAIDLRGRAFLHSYDHRQDASGKLLESIMTAPLVVAQWINMEHYFSTVDNEGYGSGSKIYHNVVGRIGVMTGMWSDLRIGLPAQTVLNGEEPYHEPMRLLAVIEAPRERIGAIINRHQLLEQLFTLRWVTLVAFDPQDGLFHHYDPAGRWRGGEAHAHPHAASHEGN